MILHQTVSSRSPCSFPAAFGSFEPSTELWALRLAQPLTTMRPGNQFQPSVCIELVPNLLEKT